MLDTFVVVWQHRPVLKESRTGHGIFLFLYRCLAALGLGAYCCVSSSVFAQGGVPLWTNRYVLTASASDDANKLAVDAQGNLFVVGTTDNGATGQDILTIKYSNAGMPLWTNRYSGPGHSNDIPNAVALDAQGNLYIAGSSVGSAGDVDFVTLAYSGAGVPLWTNRYGEQGWVGDTARAIAIGGNATVYVSGISDDDLVTIAYAGDGTPLWTNRSLYEVPVGMAVDTNGNIYVAGSIGGQYGAVAYSSAGIPLWTNAFMRGSPIGMAMDKAGNIFITGNTGNHFTTLALSNTGAPAWTNTYVSSQYPLYGYDGAEAIGVDGDGNVYVTGWSGRFDASVSIYVTVAYSPAGAQLWDRNYQADYPGYTQARALVANPSGGVYVTGNLAYNANTYAQYGTLAYSKEGVLLWAQSYGGGDYNGAEAIALDQNGNVFVTGFSQYYDATYDIYTISYSPQGVQRWARRYDGPGKAASGATATAIANDGRVYACGFSADAFLTLAYSAAGVPIWTNRYRVSTGNSAAAALAVATNGTVYVTGNSMATSSGGGYLYPDLLTVAYSRTGASLWSQRYHVSSGHSYGRGVAVGPDGSVYVIGQTPSSSGLGYDYITLAYTSTGAGLWNNRYSGPGNSTDVPNDLAVDSGGNVYVTGYSAVIDGPSDYATIAYTSAGAALWTNRYPGGSAQAIAVGPGGRVFVTGGAGVGDFTTLAYSPAGEPLWTNYYNGPANNADAAVAMVVNASGNVIVTGSSKDVRGYEHYATVAYSSAGLALWTNVYSSPGNQSDEAVAAAADGSGNVYIAGNSAGDIVSLAYSDAGLPLWTNRYDSPTRRSDYIARKWGFAAGPDGSVYIAGTSEGSYGIYSNPDAVVIKYGEPVALSIERDRDQAILRWRSAGYGLQAGPSVYGVFTNVPTATSPYTNSMAPGAKFFRLKASP